MSDTKQNGPLLGALESLRRISFAARNVPNDVPIGTCFELIAIEAEDAILAASEPARGGAWGAWT